MHNSLSQTSLASSLLEEGQSALDGSAPATATTARISWPLGRALGSASGNQLYRSRKRYRYVRRYSGSSMIPWA